MSFFGKFLLVLNLVGAAALGWLAIQDYGKRQSWSQSALAYDFILGGLPVDAEELDAQGFPLVRRLSDEGMDDAEAGKTPLVTHLFSGVGGNGVATQLAEVERVKGATMGSLAKNEAAPRQNALELANILLPFADFNLERDQYLAAQTHLKSDLTLGALRKRYQDALREGKALLAAKADRTPSEAFRLAFSSLPGLPSGAITNWIVAKLPAKDLEGVDIDALFAAALEAQRTQFKKRLADLFADALRTPATRDRKAALETQRESIARLLLGLGLGKSGEEGLKAQRRVYVVCGLKVGVGAVSERSAILRQLAGLADSSAATERGTFVADLAYLVEVARDQAGRLREEILAVEDNTRKRDEQIEILKKTKTIVETVTKDRDDALLATDEKIRKLRSLSAELLKDRVEGRDLISALVDRERQIRDLDKQVRALQGKSR